MSTRNLAEKEKFKKTISEAVLEYFQGNEFINLLSENIDKLIDEKIQSTFTDMKQKIADYEKTINTLTLQMESLQQNNKRNNLCVYGITEEENENLPNKISNLFNQKNITISPQDIEHLYRIGRFSNNKIRPVIIKVKNYENKKTIMSNAKKFKGEKIFFTEDLTQRKRTLLQEAQIKLKGRRIWPYNGNIFVEINKKNVMLRSLDDIMKYTIEENTEEIPEQ